MGFFNSFKSQVGRDAGRAISNVVFGSRHTSNRSKTSSSSNTTSARRLTAAERKLEAERRLEREKYDIQQKILKKEAVKNTKVLTDKKIAKIMSIKIPAKQEGMVDLLQELSILLTSNNWKSLSSMSFLKDDEVTEIEILNSYADTIFSKYEQCLHVLKSKYPQEPMINVFNKQYYRFMLNKFYNKHIHKVPMFLAVCFYLTIFSLFFSFCSRL